MHVLWFDFLCTCVSVHRRDRCTRTFFALLWSTPLFHVHAPPPCAPVTVIKHTFFLLHSTLYLPSFALSVVMRSSRCFVRLGSLPRLGLVLLSVRLFVSLVLLRSSLCVGGPRCFCLVFCLFGLSLCLLLLSLPPRLVPVGALVQLFAGTSLWVSGCSCDGFVALL